MKKRLLILIGLLFVSAAAFAQDKPSERYDYLGVGGGIDIPTQNWDPAYQLGGGGKIAFGTVFDKMFSLQMEVDNFFHSATVAGVATSLYDLRPLAEFKVTFPRFFLATPYVFAGPGIDIQFASASGQTTTNSSFDIVTGLGMLYPLTDHSSLFIEGKYNFTFPNSVPNGTAVQDIPIEAGMLFKL